MKLLFKNQYYSIKRFEPILLDDFSVLTGKNGSGKTQFLKAIETGNIEIEDVSKDEVAYYSYNDFLINQKTTEPASPKNTFGEIGIKKVIEYRNNLMSDYPETDELTKKIYKHAFVYGSRSIFDDVDESSYDNALKRAENKDAFFHQADLFNPPFYQFLLEIKHLPLTLEEIEMGKLKNKLRNIEQFLTDKIKLDPEFLGYYSKHSLTFLDLVDHHFEYPNFLLQSIIEEEKRYRILEAENLFKEFQTTRLALPGKFLSPLEFQQTYGLSVIERINDVLVQYAYTDFIIISDKLYPDISGNVEKWQPNIRLRNTKKTSRLRSKAYPRPKKH